MSLGVAGGEIPEALVSLLVLRCREDRDESENES